MSAPAFDHLLTGKELLNLGDIGPCELIDWRITPLSPTGGEQETIDGNIAYLLNSYVRPHNFGCVLTGEADIYTSRNPDRVKAADVAFVSINQVDSIPLWFLDIPPELGVEIVSPSDRWQELREKIDEYFSIEVHTLWIVEHKTRAIMVYSSPTDVSMYDKLQSAPVSGTLTGSEVSLMDVFGDVATQDLAR